MIFKKTATALLLFSTVFFLSGCVTGEFLVSQELQKQDEQAQKDKTNAERKAQGLPVITEEQPKTGTPPAETKSDLNPIALLYVDRPEGDPVKIIDINNIKEVFNGATSPNVTFNQNYYLTEITTYHWNKGKGTPAGTIALQDSKGKTYGPWTATLVSEVYWTAKPSVTIPAGSYTVIDSNPATWSQNADTSGQGMTWALGIPVK